MKRRAEATARTEAEIEREMASGNVVKQLIDATDIAAVVAFLASPRASYVSGSIHTIDAGQRLRA